MSTTSIYKKLLEFQKLGISINKDKPNPHFKNKYADINEVLNKVKPALSGVGIVMTQIPTPTGLKTRLQDSEGDTFIEGELPFIGATDPQKLGSNLTYLRRYSLVAMLGLEDDDDDGNTASQKAPAQPVMNAEIAIARITNAKDITTLLLVWKALPNGLQKDPEVLAMKDQRKEELTNQSE